METTATPLDPNAPRRSFFSRYDWTAGWITFLISFAIYVWTACPTVTLEDAGEMAVACDYLGVPHPPGYPLWTMTGWIFCRILSFVHFMGQPTPAWAAAVQSGFYGALTAALTAMLVSRMGARNLGQTDETRPHWHDRVAAVCGIAAGLVASLAPVVWSQAVIVEVYTMNSFFVMIQLCLAGMYLERGGNRLLFGLATMFGVSLSHYFFASAVNMTILMVAIWYRDRELFWDATAAGLLLIGLLLASAVSFSESFDALKGYLTDTARWCVGKMPEMPAEMADTLREKYLYTVGGFAALGLIPAGWAVLRVAAGGKLGRVESFLVHALFTLACVGLSVHMFVTAWSTQNALPPALARQQVLMFLSGLLFVAIPVLAWIAQVRLFPQWDRRLVAGIVLPVLLLALILAGQRFIDAFALGQKIPPNAPPVEALQLHERVLSLLQGAVVLCVAAAIWIYRGCLFGNWKRILVMGILVVGAWAAIHAYLPLASEHNPPMNWGYPRTEVGFKHAVLRGQYQRIEPSNPLSAEFVGQAYLYLRMLFGQFTVPISLFGLIPFSLWAFRTGRRKISGPILWLALSGLLCVMYVPAKLLENFYFVRSDGLAPFYGALLSGASMLAVGGMLTIVFGGFLRRFILRAYDEMALLRIGGIGLVALVCLLALKTINLKTLAVWPEDLPFANPAQVYWFDTRGLALVAFTVLAQVACALFALYAAVLFLHRFLRRAWHLPLTTHQCFLAVLSLIPASLLVFLLARVSAISADDIFSLARGPIGKTHLLGAFKTMADQSRHLQLGTFPALILLGAILAYAAGVVTVSLRRIFESFGEPVEGAAFEWTIDEGFRRWLMVTLGSFLGWGLIFACFANIKPDLQDVFIQRVKFLSSYVIYGLWIGYGLIIFCRIVLARLLEHPRRLVRYATVAMLACTPVVTGLNSFTNRKIITEVGCCELTGHDYGWQFGNYQLRGAEAIHEELRRDEEPLPNPVYPPEMTPNAIFYGGTDPGRFVPTYMIYGARVREDVYLITQNALADNTYMNVMRDLYGDRIWIPAPPDSGYAFQKYVKDIEEGRRPKTGDVRFENGRVQVSGALSVMEINGILAEMIFDRNKYRHDFYVEESYVIRWMYPYLQPHGLIMKIDKQPSNLAADTVRDDMDFWDWYSRRLLSDWKFVRDVPALKSFSKLRSAIAGLYANRGMHTESELAFKEAWMLYPMSPEANFRLVQELYLPQRRFDDAQKMIREFARLDPGNDRAVSFGNDLDRMRKANDQITTLETKFQSGSNVDIMDAFTLAELYRSMGQMASFMRLTTELLRNTNLPPNTMFDLARLLERGQQYEPMARALDNCMARLPAEVPAEVYLEMIRMYHKANRTASIGNAYEQYLKKQPRDWRAWLDITLVQMNLGQTNNAVRSLENALQFGREEALKLVNQDRRFESIKAAAMSKFQRQTPTVPNFLMPGDPTRASVPPNRTKPLFPPGGP